ncbi:MAG: dipeptide/oligopeptide/nickel ABC transporter ATP-binding protein [Methylocystaceae bacterium]|nr:MAG: dipeptide/oligopeptide/nickel ABC transporter ATP-binding protein [Methylocystaceae bacterium]
MTTRASGRVLTARNLTIGFRRDARWITAVDRLGFHVDQGETVAFVGESGCGKSITALSLIGLLPPSADVIGGEIELFDRRLSDLSERELRSLRGDRVSMIFQDPMAALNPVLTVGEQIAEAILTHRKIGRAAARDEAVRLLAQVEIADAALRIDDYPHQLSGGMRQRAMIAIAIANRPDLLIADEPTTALDATVRHQILSLLKSIQRDTGMALLLITHDLDIVKGWADRVIVMYAGRKVEERDAQRLSIASRHPYTRALNEARPRRRPDSGVRPRLPEIAGGAPPLGEPIEGCAFAGRCLIAVERCRRDAPPLRAVSPSGFVACHLADTVEEFPYG